MNYKAVMINDCLSEDIESLILKFQSLSNCNRLKILIIIARETRKSVELRKPTDNNGIGSILAEDYNVLISSTGLDKHLHVLIKSGLIRRTPIMHDQDDNVRFNYFLVDNAIENLVREINGLKELFE